MLKNRPVLMVLTGAALAVLLWFAVLAFQDSSNGTGTPNTQSSRTSTNAIPEEYTIAPASVQTVTEANSKIIISGEGVSGAGIALNAGNASLANSKIDGEGVWVMSLATDPLSETTKLDIIMNTPDGHVVRSDQSIYFVKSDLEKSLILLTEPGAHSRVLQTPFAELPAIDGFELESIDYDNSGGVIFSGNSVASGKVAIYANDNKVGESRVDRNGRWSLIFGGIMPLGEYNISAEFEPDDGASTRRLTFPFARMEPLFEAEGSPKLLVQYLDDRVQLGRALYGGGYQYTVVYSADAPIE